MHVDQASGNIESFSGIPVAKLKANDPDVTSLDLENFGCGPVEGLVLGRLLKVFCSCWVEVMLK